MSEGKHMKTQREVVKKAFDAMPLVRARNKLTQSSPQNDQK